MKKNQSLLEFLKRFDDELNCVLFLEYLMWPDGNIQSPYGTKPDAEKLSPMEDFFLNPMWFMVIIVAGLIYACSL